MCGAARGAPNGGVGGAWPTVAARRRTAVLCTPRPFNAWQKRAQDSAVDGVTTIKVELRAKRLVSAESIAASDKWLLAWTRARTSRMRSTWRGPRSAGSVAVWETRPTARPWSRRWRANEAAAVTAYSSVLSTPDPA